MVFAVFQQVDSPKKIMFHQLLAACGAGNTCQHARIGGGVDNPVNPGQADQIARISEITVNKMNSLLLQKVPILLTARASQAVKSNNLEALDSTRHLERERTADETADSSDKQFHEMVADGSRDGPLR